MKSTQRFNKNQKGISCLNCGQPLFFGDNFCSNCGQVNDELPLSIKQFISEFFAGFFSFDTRFFHTIIPLLFKPGKVSKEYIKGKRRKYTNPFKLYLHTSIVFFLILGLSSTINDLKGLRNKEYKTSFNPAVTDSVMQALEKDSIHIEGTDFMKRYQKKIDSVFSNTDYKAQFNSKNISKEVKDSLYNRLVKMGMDTNFLDIDLNLDSLKDLDLESQTKEAHKLAVKGQLKNYFSRNNITYEVKVSDRDFVINSATKDTKIGVFYHFCKDNKDFSPAKALDSLGYKRDLINIFLYQKARDVIKLKEDKDYQKMYLKSIISKISIALFFLLPILTLLYSLLYIRHKYQYTEHLVVVFNIQTVFFILLIIGILLDTLLGTDFFTPIFQFIFIFYVYKTLRNFYKQGRFKTLIKFAIINLGYFFMALIGVMIISFIAFII